MSRGPVQYRPRVDPEVAAQVRALRAAAHAYDRELLPAVRRSGDGEHGYVWHWLMRRADEVERGVVGS